MRTQPPFLADMENRIYKTVLFDPNPKLQKAALEIIRQVYSAAIKEYYTLWMSASRYNSETVLEVLVSPEAEPGHFNSVPKPLADDAGISIDEHIKK